MKTSYYSFSWYALLWLGISIAQPLQAQGLLWKVTGNGLKAPAWLYGTMHVKDHRVFNLPEGWEQKMEQSGRLILEIDLSAVPDPSKIMRMMQSPEDSTLDKILTQESYAYLRQWFQDSLGMALEPFKGMKPFMLMSMVQQSRMSSEMPLALDAWLAQRAKGVNIPVIGLETLEEQMQVIDRMSISEQAHMLMEMVNTDARRVQQEADLMDAYLNGQLERLLYLASQWETDPQFKHEIITVRNRIMAGRLSEMLEAGPAFVAVGALHLPGTEGLIALLRARGYTVEPAS
jgi:uncharacterized protein YbaP (TraB family)